MAYIPCPGCFSDTPAQVPSIPTIDRPTLSDTLEHVTGDVVDAAENAMQSAVQNFESFTPVADAAGATDYVITWDPPDTRKEKIGLAVAGGLAFLAPFVGFAVAARVARGSKGYLKPVGAGALTFFAMRAAAVAALHFSDNLPSVTTPAALGAVLPQVPRRTAVPQVPQVPQYPKSFGRAPCRGCR